jgi:hypothetical protein
MFAVLEKPRGETQGGTCIVHFGIFDSGPHGEHTIFIDNLIKVEMEQR